MRQGISVDCRLKLGHGMPCRPRRRHKTARLWAADGRAGPVLIGHTGLLQGALQLADGRILTWSGDNTARL